LDEGYDAALLVDALPRGGAAGTLYVIEPEMTGETNNAKGPDMVDAHNMEPMEVLNLFSSMGSRLERILLVGCERAHRKTRQR